MGLHPPECSENLDHSSTILWSLYEEITSRLIFLSDRKNVCCDCRREVPVNLMFYLTPGPYPISIFTEVDTKYVKMRSFNFITRKA